MTRKHVTKKQQYWPGSNIIKSSGNAFDWRNTAQGLYSDAELSHLQSYVKSQMVSTEFKPSIPTYSRARHEKTVEKRTAT